MTGHEIRSVRESLKLTQTEFGKLVHAHWSSVSNWERDLSPPAPFQLALIEQFRTVAHRRQIQQAAKGALLGAGVALALAILLEHLTTKPKLRRRHRKK